MTVVVATTVAMSFSFLLNNEKIANDIFFLNLFVKEVQFICKSSPNKILPSVNHIITHQLTLFSHDVNKKSKTEPLPC